VFQEFMTKATEVYGGGNFEIPPGGHFIKINRHTGERLPGNATGKGVVAEYFRDGEEPVFGLAFDGGFAMGSNLPLFEREDGAAQSGTTVNSETGEVVRVPGSRNLGTISSGGLY
jgi:penicillin-binding protein 1A